MEIRSNICTSLIKTPQNLTLSDFFDNVPDGEFGVALMSLLIYTIFNHQIFLDSVDFLSFLRFWWRQRAADINDHVTLMGRGLYFTLIHPRASSSSESSTKRRNINKIIKKDALGYSKLKLNCTENWLGNPNPR